MVREGNAICGGRGSFRLAIRRRVKQAWAVEVDAIRSAGVHPPGRLRDGIASPCQITGSLAITQVFCINFFLHIYLCMLHSRSQPVLPNLAYSLSPVGMNTGKNYKYLSTYQE